MSPRPILDGELFFWTHLCSPTLFLTFGIEIAEIVRQYPLSDIFTVRIRADITTSVTVNPAIDAVLAYLTHRQ